MGDYLDRVLRTLSVLEGTVRRAPRKALTAAGGALVIVVVCASLLIAQLQPGQPAQVAHGLTQATPTSTSTDTPTATATATKAPTPTRVPTPKPVPKTPPPPPPVPTKPPATPTTVACPTYAPPTPTPTATGSATTVGTSTGSPTCTPCPWYTGNNPSQQTLQADLDAAADTYGLPRHLVEAVAWQESKWHEDVTSCDGGLGLMQIQYTNVTYFNGLSVPECNISPTTYDVFTDAGNALMGAKYLRYLACYWSYWGGWTATPPHSLSNPAAYTIDWYYLNANLPYPDTTRTDNKPSVCQTLYNNPAYPEYAAMTSTIATPFPWPCQYDPTKTTDSTLLDVTLSAYNAGAGAVGTCGCIPNPGYVSSVETFIPQFASGALPTAS